jgi:hypothetical protein
MAIYLWVGLSEKLQEYFSRRVISSGTFSAVTSQSNNNRYFPVNKTPQNGNNKLYLVSEYRYTANGGVLNSQQLAQLSRLSSSYGHNLRRLLAKNPSIKNLDSYWSELKKAMNSATKGMNNEINLAVIVKQDGSVLPSRVIMVGNEYSAPGGLSSKFSDNRFYTKTQINDATNIRVIHNHPGFDEPNLSPQDLAYAEHIRKTYPHARVQVSSLSENGVEVRITLETNGQKHYKMIVPKGVKMPEYIILHGFGETGAVSRFFDIKDIIKGLHPEINMQIQR